MIPELGQMLLGNVEKFVIFYRDYIKFRSLSKSRDSTNAVIGQMMHNLSTNSAITDMVLKSIERTNEC